jgi:hypothetical protein
MISLGAYPQCLYRMHVCSIRLNRISGAYHYDLALCEVIAIHATGLIRVTVPNLASTTGLLAITD